MRIFLAGHEGMVGKALKERLLRERDVELVTAGRRDLDLSRQSDVDTFFRHNAIDQVYLAAAKVGGIYANSSYPAQFIYENLMIQANVINAAHKNDVPKLLFLGSSCIYPKHSAQPIQEASLLSGGLEETNEPYAIAKIAGIKMCESYNREYGRDYRSVMPTNLYGPGDNFHLDHSHVIPAMMMRFDQAKRKSAKEVLVWGSGTPRREFLHVFDMADACVFWMNLPRDMIFSESSMRQSHVNIGTGVDCSIAELAQFMKAVIGFKGDISFDVSKPDGTPRKLLDVTKLDSFGWRAEISLRNGLGQTYDWYLKNYDSLRSY